MVARKTTVDRRSVEPDLARILIDGHVYQADSAGRLLPCPSLNDFRAAWAESGPELTAAACRKVAWYEAVGVVGVFLSISAKLDLGHTPCRLG